MKLTDLNEVLSTPAAPRARQRLRLGDLLVAQRVIDGEQLQRALAEQKRSGRRLGRVLIDDGVTDEEAIGRALAQQLKVPFFDLTPDMVQPRVARQLSEAQARRLRALPIDELGPVLRLAMADPTDYQAFDDAQKILRRDLDLVVVTESRLNAVLDRLYTKADAMLDLAREIELEFAPDPQLAAGGGADDAPVARLLQTVLEDAMRTRASDIHIEPQERRLQIRFRVDGVLQTQTEAEARIAPAVVQRVKLMAGLDIAERRLPQDGRCAVRVRNQPVDIRISTMPSQHGESVVMRLLPQSGGLLELNFLGMPEAVLAKVREFMGVSHGMMLVTGPTGSGKTTTLYATLAELNSPQTKIVTVEDPVEYRLAGTTQVQVNDKIGLGFATVLRSTLRQDPDVVLVGEMRDRDTMETGLRAAMTGHLVLSTLHTNDAASTPLRLLDMGAARFLVASSLRLVLAQRLVRTVCPECARSYRASAQELAFLRAVLGDRIDGAELRHGGGCGTCNRTGFLGRHGVYELLDMSPAVVSAFNGGDTDAYLRAAREAIGTLSLARHACELVLAGKTTVREAMRQVGRVIHD